VKRAFSSFRFTSSSFRLLRRIFTDLAFFARCRPRNARAGLSFRGIAPANFPAGRRQLIDCCAIVPKSKQRMLHQRNPDCPEPPMIPLLPIPVAGAASWPTRNRNWVGLDTANRENEHDAAEKRKNGPRVQQTTTFIVGHSIGRVAIARTICKERVQVEEEEGRGRYRDVAYMLENRAMTESSEETI